MTSVKGARFVRTRLGCDLVLQKTVQQQSSSCKRWQSRVRLVDAGCTGCSRARGRQVAGEARKLSPIHRQLVGSSDRCVRGISRECVAQMRVRRPILELGVRHIVRRASELSIMQSSLGRNVSYSRVAVTRPSETTSTGKAHKDVYVAVRCLKGADASYHAWRQ